MNTNGLILFKLDFYLKFFLKKNLSKLISQGDQGLLDFLINGNAGRNHPGFDFGFSFTVYGEQAVLRSPEAQKKSSRQNATLKSHKPLSHYSHPGMNNQGLHGQVDGADGLSDDRGMADMPSERAA